MAEEVEMTPISADELPPKAAPFGAAPAAPVKPATPDSAPAADSTASTIRLKPVIRKPVIRKPGEIPASTPAPATAAAKRQTQSLKSVTGPIPAQATLRKTGIIAEGILTPAQQQAAKSKTSRISLESAIGVAPTAPKGPAPLKTIRLRRPTDLNKPPAPSPFAAPKPATEAAPAPAPADDSAAAVTMTPVGGGEPDAAVTQKKTLKLQRPGVSIKRPTLGVGGDTSAAAPGMQPVEMGDVPDLQPLSPADFGTAAGASESAGVPGWLLAITTITSIAALLVLGAVFYFLFTEGCAPVAGDNYTAFITL